MAKLNDNIYFNKMKKKILDNEFATKDDLLNFINKYKEVIINDPYINQEFQESFIKLNEESYNDMTKMLLEYYDKQKKEDLVGLELEGISAFEVEDKDYIKVVKPDGSITILDDSVSKENFVEQFKDKQNEMVSAQTADSTENKEVIIEAMEKEKEEINLESSENLNIRELTYEEKKEFAAIMNISDADEINFLVDPSRNLYINKDTSEVYFVNKNEDGNLEVRQANEISSETNHMEKEIIDEVGNEETVIVDRPLEPDFDSMDESDLIYIVENKKNEMPEELYEKAKKALDIKKNNEQKIVVNKEQEKGYQYTKKLPDFLTKPYNGFVSTLFLISIVGFFGVGFLMLIISRIYN